MAIELQTFASGDTDYIAKLNANIAALTDAISTLQAQAEASAGGGQMSVGFFFDLLFNSKNGLVGVDSYKPVPSGNTLIITAGGMYQEDTNKIVQSFADISLSFIGILPSTQYIVVDAAGQPVRMETQEVNAVYSVYWSGSGFYSITRLVPVFFDTAEADGSRISTALNTAYHTLDARLEAAELMAKDALTTADGSLDFAYDLQQQMGIPIRKVGISVDGTIGVKGAIQIDFSGVIVGWSCIADQVGDLVVEVSVTGSSPPDKDPHIPDPVADKITASAPIILSGKQSATENPNGVSSWQQDVFMWDVIQFNVVAVSAITRATLYLRIEEARVIAIQPLEEDSNGLIVSR